MGRYDYITQPFLTIYRKSSSPDVGEGVLTLPLAGTARNGGENGLFVQPTFSQTGTQGRAGTPAPTTGLERVRNI